MIRSLLVALVLLLPSSAVLAEFLPVSARPGHEPIRLMRHGSKAVLISGGAAYEITAIAGAMPALRFTPLAFHTLPVGGGRPGMLPMSHVALAGDDPAGGAVAAAWLAEPTDRYAHAVLGDALEAGALMVETRGGAVLSYRLGPEHVFEDLMPRLADVTGDGSAEILLVRASRRGGAALTLFGVREGTLALIAESTDIGSPNRWLNPVGVGDFLGIGQPQAAVVRTPHIGGILILYTLEQDRLVERFRASGYSNHRIGSPELGLSAVFDADGDGLPDIALPGIDRRSLSIVSLRDGQQHILGRTEHDAAIDSALVVADLDDDGRLDLVYGLADGTVAALLRR